MHILEKLQAARADLAAASAAIPARQDAEDSLREELERLAEPWADFVDALASQIANGQRPSCYVAAGRPSTADDSIDLLLAGLVALAGPDALLKNVLRNAERMPAPAIRLTATEKAEAVAELSRARYVAELAAAEAHFRENSGLPPDLHPAAILGIPLSEFESRFGPVRYVAEGEPLHLPLPTIWA